MSLRLYCGEYMVSPVPLHFGMNQCSHACFYCFANLNRAGRRMVNNDLPRIARWYEREKGPLEYWFMKNGHPLLVSNDTDPFAKSNCESFKALFELSAQYGFALCYQTKGGDEEAQAMALNGRKTMFYVSLTSDDNDILRRMEPGAPSYEARLDLIGRALALGHYVVIGLNPFIPGWWRDLPAALKEWRRLGAGHIWSGELHFSRFQIDAMTASVRARNRDLLDYGLLRNKPDDMVRGEILDYAQRLGFNIFNGICGSAYGFWRPYFALGFPFFPTLDGLFDYLHVLGKGKPVVFDLAWFNWWTNIDAPGELSIYRDYLQSYARSLRNAKEDMRCRCFADVHRIEWRIENFPTHLRSREISFCSTVDDTGKDSLLVDDFGNKLLCFVPGGTDDLAVPASEAVYVYNCYEERG